MKTRIFITCRFAAFHFWKDAPKEHAYLRDLHRHVFHVRLEKAVEHDDRDIEFIELKTRVQKHCQSYLAIRAKVEGLSCEQMAIRLLERFEADLVEVSEDGENGAIVTK